LRAGNYCAVVHTLPGRFAGNVVTWQAGTADNQVFADAVCYKGEKRPFDFQQLPEVVLATGIEILPAGKSPSEPSPRLNVGPSGVIEATWDVPGGLRVVSPVKPLAGSGKGTK
jgi:hypothetical protein